VGAKPRPRIRIEKQSGICYIASGATAKVKRRNSMRIEKRKVGDVAVFDIKGKILAGEGVDELRESINQAVNDAETKILFNFKDVPYLDSTGLGEVVRSYTSVKNRGGVVKIVNLTNKVHDLLSVTKLITVFETFNEEDEAIKSFS